MKFEQNTRRNAPNMLNEEVKRLRELGEQPAPQGILEVFDSGYDRASLYNFAVLELVGEDLETRLKNSGGSFSLRTTALIAEQCLQRLEYVHSRAITHRDIKPENFAVGLGAKCNIIYLLDFGLSQKFYDEKGHLPLRSGLSFTGNARFASIRAQQGLQQSRRDDLEAVGHMLFQFLLGKLPWSDLGDGRGSNVQEKILALKETTPVSELCEGFPKQFGDYLEKCRLLQFAEIPDYGRLRSLFVDIRQKIDAKNGTAIHADHLLWLADQEEIVPQGLVSLAPPGNWPQPDDDNDWPQVDFDVSCGWERTISNASTAAGDGEWMRERTNSISSTPDVTPVTSPVKRWPSEIPNFTS
jgi:serine/threonine protein kinase